MYAGFFAPLADLSQVYNTYQSAGAALDRINNYFKADDILEEIDKEESLIIKIS